MIPELSPGMVNFTGMLPKNVKGSCKTVRAQGEFPVWPSFNPPPSGPRIAGRMEYVRPGLMGFLFVSRTCSPSEKAKGRLVRKARRGRRKERARIAVGFMVDLVDDGAVADVLLPFWWIGYIETKMLLLHHVFVLKKI